MLTSKALVNKGIAIIGEEKRAPGSPVPPVVVIGSARGGTSMVAGVLAKLGVFMGDQAVHPVYEDVRLSTAFESGDSEMASHIVLEYSQRHAHWGWKRPSIIERLEEVDDLTKQPLFIFIYKDVFSIAQRNSISMLSEFMPSMERALQQYQKTLDFLKERKPRAMLVSYDKALAYPDEFVGQVISFCGLSPSSEHRESALAFINPEPEDYLDSSRITKSQGYIDHVSREQVRGWARRVHGVNPAVVNIYHNDRQIGSVLASAYRKDLEEKFGQDCAFAFEMPDTVVVQHGDEISAIVEGDVEGLKNSPYIVND